MAKQYKQPSIVSGMSINDILSMDNKAFNRLNTSELRKVVGRLVSAGNKRLRSFSRVGESSPATRHVAKSGGVFSTKGKDLNALRAEYTRAKNFLQSKTGTLKEWRKTQSEIVSGLKKQGIDIKKDVINKLKGKKDAVEWNNFIKSIGGKRELNKLVNEMTRESLDSIWTAYEDLKEMSPDVANRGLKYPVLKDIADMMVETNKTSDEIALALKENLSQIYEEQAEVQNGVSEFFEIE